MKIIPAPLEAEFSGDYVHSKPEEKIKINPSLENEEYVLTIDNGALEIEGGSEKAVFYAQQTVKQIALQGDGLPICKIHDKPRFPYRGFMIDSARHMQSIDEIKKIIDVMSLLKFNVFHWHLTEDQGWRFESVNYPELNTKAAVRPFSDFGKTINNKPYGRVYTKEEMKDIVAYCAERFIDVVPEFDMPGHVSSLLSVFPELSCKGEKVEIKTHQGIYSDILCPAKDETYEVVEKILDEFCEIFPYEYFHIGGDEAPSKQWEDCPQCKFIKSSCNLSSWAEYQNYYMNTIIDYLDKKGKKTIVWNDAAKGSNLDKRAILQFWKETYTKPSTDFANGGGKMILSPFTYYYMDYDYQITPMNRTLTFNPKISGLTDEGYENVIGLEAPIWTEYIWENEKLEKLLFPRIIAVAQTAWSEKKFDYDSFVNEMEFAAKLIKNKDVVFENEKEWAHSKFSTPIGWLRFVHEHYTHGKKEVNYDSF